MRDGSDLADFQKIEVHELTRYSTQFPLYACIVILFPANLGSRYYVASKQEKTWLQSIDFCTGMNLGRAVVDTAEKYEDLAALTGLEIRTRTCL